jgi:hypothetical protein
VVTQAEGVVVETTWTAHIAITYAGDPSSASEPGP